MRVKILKSTVANKKAIVAGKEVDLDKAEAVFLIHIGKAVEVEVKAKPVEEKKQDTKSGAPLISKKKKFKR